MAPLARHINAWKSLALASLWAAALHTRAASYPRAALTLTTWTAYTLLWLLKSAIIPDKRWDKEASRDQRVVVWTMLNLHLIAPLTLLLAPDRAPLLTPITLFTTVASFALGTFLHVAADAYKAGALAARPRHLVTGGPFRLCRNPNYLGSALQYVGLLAPAAPALGTASPLAFTGIALFIAIEWLPNMAAKDASLRKQHGERFAAWAQATPLFVPSVGSVYRTLIGWWLHGGGEAGESTVTAKTAATQTAEEVIEMEVTAAAATTARGRRRAPKAA